MAKLPEQLTKMPLYDALKYTDGLNDDLCKQLATFSQDLKEFESLPGHKDVAGQIIIPQIDVLKIQRDLIEAHRGNHYLDEVLIGNDTFVNIITDLYDRKHKGWNAWIPLRKDDMYNQEIERLNQIVRTDFGTGGVREWCKPVSIASFYGVFGMTTIGLPLIGDHPWAPLTVGVGLGTWGMVLGRGMALSEKDRYVCLRSKTEYLDKKVKACCK